MATVNDILLKIEQLAPKGLAEDFDNVGLLLGRADRQVKRLMVMLDADKHTINEAVTAGVDLIITHHPIIHSPVKVITQSNYLSLIENNIAVISAHTNLDSTEGGVNDVLAETLGLRDIKKVSVTENSPLCGRAGIIDKCTLKQLIGLVKVRLGIDNVRYVGNLDTLVSKVGVLGGSGGDFSPEMKNYGCDVYITADVKYHQAQLADDIDMCVIDAGHFETENPVCKTLAEYLQSNFADVEILVSQRKNSYINYE